jgi:hypothetical protein
LLGEVYRWVSAVWEKTKDGRTDQHHFELVTNIWEMEIQRYGRRGAFVAGEQVSSGSWAIQSPQQAVKRLTRKDVQTETKP